MVTSIVNPLDQFRTDLRRLNEAGVSGAELARRFGVHRNVTWNWRKNHGPLPRLAELLRPIMDDLLKENGLTDQS